MLPLDDPSRYPQNLQKKITWAWAEVWIKHLPFATPTNGTNRVITYDIDYEMGITQIVRKTRAGMRIVLGAFDLTGGVGGTAPGKFYTLALYYLIHNPNTYFAYESVSGSNHHSYPSHLSNWQWNSLVEYDIGLPAPVPDGYVDFEGKRGTNQHYIFASGPDPFDSTLTYRVLARNFTNGLVLAKMLPAGSVVDYRSATTHPLDRPYLILRSDGKPGQLVNEVTIHNNEGLILVRID